MRELADDGIFFASSSLSVVALADRAPRNGGWRLKELVFRRANGGSHPVNLASVSAPICELESCRATLPPSIPESLTL